jgi:hypothetical protein
MSFTKFAAGKINACGGMYLEPTPQERIRHTDEFVDPNLPGEQQVTIS